MYMHYDTDEWDTVTESRPCGSCGGDMRKCNGACTGMSGISQRRRDPAEVARIKADRLIAEEESILVRADAIRRERAIAGA